MSTLKSFVLIYIKDPQQRLKLVQCIMDIATLKLQENNKLSYESELKKNGCWNTLKSMSNSESPGTDGLD